MRTPLSEAHPTSLRVDFLHVIQEIKNRTGAPGLRIARIVAMSSVFVGKLREASPCIVLDMVSNRE